MTDIVDILQFGATFVFGIFIGALIAEGALFVPFWKSLKAEEFHKLHPSFGPKLYRFYAPLTISATILSLANAILSFYLASQRAMILSIASFCALSMVAIYFYYFKNANAQLAKGDLNEEKLSQLLGSWERWHWTRVAVGIVGFICLIDACFIIARSPV